MVKEIIENTWNSLINLFGESVQVVSRDAETFSADAIFRESSEQFGPRFTHEQINANVPHLKYRPQGREIQAGDTIVVRGTQYHAEDLISDGHGGVVIHLEKVGKFVCS